MACICPVPHDPRLSQDVPYQGQPSRHVLLKAFMAPITLK